MSTAIPRRKYPVSLAPGSQATSGPVSTWMGDRLGIPGAVDFFLLHCAEYRLYCFEMAHRAIYGRFFSFYSRNASAL